MRLLWLVLVVACGSPQSRAPEEQRAPACKAVIHVPSIPPIAGETLAWDSTSTTSGVSANGDKLASHYELATTERILTTSPPTTEITFKKSHATGTDVAMAPLEGNTYRLTMRDKREDFTREGTELAEDIVRALDRYSRHDVGRPHWLLGLLLERTFVEGQETHLTEDSGRLWDKVPADIRITLRGVEGPLAKFDLVFRATGNTTVTLRSTATVDTEHGRLVDYSIDSTTARATLKVTEHFRYANGSRQPPRRRDGCAATLHVPWIPPRVGEVTESEVTLAAEGPQGTMSSNFVVRAKVLESNGDVATAVELRHGKHVFNGVEKPADTSLLVFRSAGGKTTTARDGVELDAGAAEQASRQAGFLHEVGTRMSLARLVTDRTFEVGVESHFPHDQVRSLPNADLRIILISTDGSTAKFALTLEVPPPADAPITITLPPWRGELELDIQRARVRRFSLGSEGSGMKATTSVRFTYPPGE